jgi:hypothetical protein
LQHVLGMEARVDDASLRCHHQGLLQTLATPSLPVKSQAVVLWPGLMTQPTDDACSRAGGSGICTHLGRWGLWAATGAAAASRADRRSMEREGGARARGGGGGPSRHVGTKKGQQTALKQVLRPAWLMCAKTLPLAGLWVPT